MLTVILQAIKEADLIALQKLWQENASSFHELDTGGNSLLHIAAMENQPDIVSFLVVRGIEVDLRNKSGATALWLAAASGKKEASLRLIALQANVDIPNQYEATPLFMAAREGHMLIVLALLEAGANPLTPNCNHVSPCDIALDKEFDAIADIIARYATKRHSTSPDGKKGARLVRSKRNVN